MADAWGDKGAPKRKPRIQKLPWSLVNLTLDEAYQFLEWSQTTTSCSCRVWSRRLRMPAGSCTPVLLTASTVSAAQDPLPFPFFLPSFCSFLPSVFAFQCSFLTIYHFISFIHPCNANLSIHSSPGTRLWACEMLSYDTVTQEHQYLVMRTDQTWTDAIQVMILCNDYLKAPRESEISLRLIYD